MRLLTSSLPLELYPACRRRQWFTASPSRRIKARSSFGAKPRLQGLAPPAASPCSIKRLPTWERFSDRNRLREPQGRPGKRPRATAEVLNPPPAAGAADPDPAAAAIIIATTTPRLLWDWRETREGARWGGETGAAWETESFTRSPRRTQKP